MAIAKKDNFQVSGTGGAGTNGQPVRYISGGDYSEGKENLELQSAATMNKSGVEVPTGRGAALRAMPMDQQVVPLTAPSERPDEHPATGAALGPGAGTEIMASPTMVAAQNDADMQKLAAFLPVYAKIAESPNATNATRNFYRWLRSQVV